MEFKFLRRNAKMETSCPKCRSDEIDYTIVWKKNELHWRCECEHDWWTQ